MLRDTIQQYVYEALKKTGYTIAVPEEVTLTHPPERFGDFASNAAFIIAKKQGGHPKEIATTLATTIREAEHKEIQSVSETPEGFINIYITEETLLAEAQKLLTVGSGVIIDLLEGSRVSVEYTDANPFKQLHAGHLMTNAIGESLARIIEAVGGVVVRVCYQGDVGLHVAKCLWALAQRDDDEVTAPILGEAYARGDAAYREGGTQKEEIENYNQLIYAQSDPLVNSLYELGKRVSLDHFEEMYRRVGTKFDEYIFESEAAPVGLQEVQTGLTKGVFVKDDGAVIFQGEKHNLHTRVFITTKGLPTYEAKEIGLALVKEERIRAERDIVVTANEISEYLRVIVAVLEKLHPTLAKKIEHVSHGTLSLTGGKMSSRTGDVLSADVLLDTIGTSVMQQAKKGGTTITPSIADAIAVASLKYAILRQAQSNNIVFDTAQATSFEGDSGAYLLYARVRAKALLDRGGTPDKGVMPYSHLPLLRLLYQFEEVVARSYTLRESHHLAQYLSRLTSVYSHWYATEKILDQEDSDERLQLVLVCIQVLERGLDLLGIRPVDKM